MTLTAATSISAQRSTTAQHSTAQRERRRSPIGKWTRSNRIRSTRCDHPCSFTATHCTHLLLHTLGSNSHSTSLHSTRAAPSQHPHHSPLPFLFPLSLPPRSLLRHRRRHAVDAQERGRLRHARAHAVTLRRGEWPAHTTAPAQTGRRDRLFTRSPRHRRPFLCVAARLSSRRRAC